MKQLFENTRVPFIWMLKITSVPLFGYCNFLITPLCVFCLFVVFLSVCGLLPHCSHFTYLLPICLFVALLPTLRTYVSSNQESTLQYQNSRIFLDSRIILEIRWTTMGIYRGGSEHEYHITWELKNYFHFNSLSQKVIFFLNF